MECVLAASAFDTVKEIVNLTGLSAKQVERLRKQIGKREA